MRNATIFLATTYGAQSPYSHALGRQLRALRRESRLSQRQLAQPLSGSYVSSIEAGRVVPSLPALLLMLERLGVSAGAFFEAVNCRLQSV